MEPMEHTACETRVLHRLALPRVFDSGTRATSPVSPTGSAERTPPPPPSTSVDRGPALP